ncbi:hypothetical protein ABPG75_003401 [Micractinium tetrahymenae]
MDAAPLLAHPARLEAGEAAALAQAELVVRVAYSSLRPFYSNLLDDLGATDFFVIGGDALLLELLGGERLDWQHGGQFLQLRAALEAFVAGIDRANTAGLHRWVVFFERSAAVLPNAAARAARALVAAWLPALGVPVLRFPSWWSEEWLTWVRRTRPAMLLLTDLPQRQPDSSGTSSEDASQASHDDSHTSISDSVSRNGADGSRSRCDNVAAWQQRRLFLQAAVVHGQAAGLQVAFMSELRSPEGHLFGFRTGWRSVARGNGTDAVMSAAADVGRAFLDCAAAQPSQQHGADAVPHAVSLLNHIAETTHAGGVRAALGAACCGLAAARAPPSVPAEAQPGGALRLPAVPAGLAGSGCGGSWQEVQHGLHALLSGFHLAAAALLCEAGSTSGSTAGECGPSGSSKDGDGSAEGHGAASLALDASMADWLDGRLLHCIALALWQGLPVGPLAAGEVSLLRSLLQQAGSQAAAAGYAAAASWEAQLPPGIGCSPAAIGPPAAVPAPAHEEALPSQLPAVQGNALVEAVAGSSSSSSNGQSAFGSDSGALSSQGSSGGREYAADYHWHTGRPIDASQMEIASDEREVRLDLAAMSLEEIAAAEAVPRYLRRRAQTALAQIDLLLKANLHSDARSREKDAKADIMRRSRATTRALQTYYRHLEKYAKSLDATKFSHPARDSPGEGGAKRGGGDGGGRQGGQKREGGKIAELRRQNETRLAAKSGGSAEEQWAAVRRQLEGAAAKGWTAELAAEVERVLASLATKSPAAYLAAASWRLQQLSAEWAARCLPNRTGREGSGEAQASAAVQLWAAVADLLQRGLLQPGHGSGAPEEARLAAAKQCTAALRALGLEASAQHVASLAVPSGAGSSTDGGKKAGKAGGKGSKGDRKEGMNNGEGSDAGSAQAGSSGSGRAGSRGKAGAGTSAATGPAGLGLSDARFQTRHCGHLLPHEAPPERDPRVETFNPDPWQRQVLDTIDDGASALIVAPTSSGKTFIASYCISSVVRRLDDQEGVVVFVAPTKALVNQVAAQMYKDFEASTGVFTRDYRHNVEGCRILVTVPACLEILLLSPSSQEWVRRVRYAILDEVHCMREVHLGEGGVRDGAGSTWEHILLLLRCPFLALSATIGNPQEFAGWLASVKRLQREQDAAPAAARQSPWAGSRPYDVQLIQHSVRHSNLRLHTYVPACLEDGSTAGGGGAGGSGWQPPLSEQVASLERLAGRGGSGEGLQCGSLARMNPLAVLEVEDLQGSFPPELSLEPADVEQLYDSMHSALHAPPAATVVNGSSASTDGNSGGGGSADGSSEWHARAAAQLAALGPEQHFAGASPFLSRQQVRRYEAALKALLLGWAEGDEPQGRAAAAAALAAVRHQFQPPPEHDSLLEGGDAFVGLVLDLLRRGLLPAIAFSFERRICHALAEQLVLYLEACEEKELREREDFYRAKRQEAERAARAVKAGRDREPDKRRAGEERAEEPAGPGWDEGAVLPEFSLAGKPKRLSTAEIEELIRETTAAGGFEAHDPLLRGLRRGIGIHHGGLPKVYRQVVEILFRAGHLRVVIATGTLAFGIHMPCRTVVFAGDHLFLSALQFRQMMGRAGRRGFDPLGHVVFFGVGPRKVRSLLISPVPRLLGHFPLTATMVLRALSLHHLAAAASSSSSGSSSSSAKAASAGKAATVLVRDTLAALFQRPFFAEGQPRLLQQVQHLFAFSAGYLRHSGAIGRQGEPLGLAGLLCHLHWTDPANLALASLLRCGVLDDICRGAVEHMSDAAFEPLAEQLLVLFSHLFGAKPLHRAVVERPERFRDSPSKVVLEPLPPAVQAAISRHNSEALALFVGYVRSYVAGLDGQAEEALPVSCVRLPAAPAAPAPGHEAQFASAAAPPPGSLLGLLATLRVRYAACSPFAALSGRGDDFSSMDDLVRSVRSGVLIDVATLPTVGMVDRHGQPVPLNRFALDYWKHGQKEALVAANGLREGEAWQALSAFSDVLRVTATALAQMLPPGAFHPVAYCLGRLASEFKARFDKFNVAAQGRRSGF